MKRHFHTLPHRPTLEMMLENSVPEPNTGCWLWLGSVTDQGYARHGKIKIARLILGIVDTPLQALHHCDMPLCINPAHLYAGDNAQNRRDAVRRKRHPGAPGKKYAAKLTAEMVTAIRQDPRPLRAVAAEYGINYTNVSQIRRRLTWRDVP